MQIFRIIAAKRGREKYISDWLGTYSWDGWSAIVPRDLGSVTALWYLILYGYGVNIFHYSLYNSKKWFYIPIYNNIYI